jgi:hypothetical protein
MKTPSKKIHTLIHSLSHSELSSFKKVLKKKHNAELYKLFNLINKQEEYDEQTLLKNNFNYSGKTHFAKLKMTLTQILLNFLLIGFKKDIHEENTQLLFDKISLLYSKNMREECFLYLNELHKMATGTEDLATLEKILHWRFNLSFSYPSATQRMEQQKQILKEQNKLFEIKNNLLKYLALYVDVAELSARSPRELTSVEINRLKNILVNELLIREAYLSVEAELYYNSILSMIYLLLRNFERAIFYSINFNAIFEKNSFMLAKRKIDYMVGLHNLCSLYYRTQNEKHYHATLKKFNTINCTTTLERFRFAELYLRLTVRGLTFNYNSGEIDKKLSSIAKTFTALRPNMRAINRITVCFDLMGICLCMGNLKNANYWLSEILNDKTNILNDIKVYSYIYELIILLEKGELALFDLRLNSLQRKSYAFKKDFIIVNQMLILFKNISQNGYSISNNEVSKKSLNMLKEFLLNENLKDITIYAEIWLQSKLSKAKMSALLQEFSNNKR